MEDDTTAANAIKLLEPQSPLIFLSYAKEDKDKVKAIYRKLRTEQLNPWLDVADLMPGQEWDKVIIRTIRNARFVIVFLSKHSVTKRGYVQKEIKEALDAADLLPDGEIFIIPVRLEACVVPERLSKWQWIDIFRPHGFTKIITSLKENLDLTKTDLSRSRINAQLLVMGYRGPEAMFPLRKVISLLGRSDSHSGGLPDINLSRFDTTKKVSRTHALIFRLGNSFIIKDCGSKNGTIVNESVILRENQTRVLKSGDRLRLGDIRLHFVRD
jgi:hypothetical protein